MGRSREEGVRFKTLVFGHWELDHSFPPSFKSKNPTQGSEPRGQRYEACAVGPGRPPSASRSQPLVFEVEASAPLRPPSSTHAPIPHLRRPAPLLGSARAGGLKAMAESDPLEATFQRSLHIQKLKARDVTEDDVVRCMQKQAKIINGPGIGSDLDAQRREMPCVFLCSRCQRPLGDSLSWEGTDFEGNFFFLNAVSANVYVDKEQKLSTRKNEYGCMIETLSCNGCSLNIGQIYRCTPRHLDYKRDLFCFDVSSVDGYVLGSAENEAVPENEGPVTLDKQDVMESILKKLQVIMHGLELRVSLVESVVSGLCDTT
ncbi:protein Mis18-alpha [Monodelphis domestica]|nr:protein Mis18-alpha [Monodelphis domestica]